MGRKALAHRTERSARQPRGTVARHASLGGGKARRRGSICGVVAVAAVELKSRDMHRMVERDRLECAASLLGHGRRANQNHEANRHQHYEGKSGDNGAPRDAIASGREERAHSLSSRRLVRSRAHEGNGCKREPGGERLAALSYRTRQDCRRFIPLESRIWDRCGAVIPITVVRRMNFSELCTRLNRDAPVVIRGGGVRSLLPTSAVRGG